MQKRFSAKAATDRPRFIPSILRGQCAVIFSEPEQRGRIRDGERDRGLTNQMLNHPLLVTHLTPINIPFALDLFHKDATSALQQAPEGSDD